MTLLVTVNSSIWLCSSPGLFVILRIKLQSTAEGSETTELFLRGGGTVTSAQSAHVSCALSNKGGVTGTTKRIRIIE